MLCFSRFGVPAVITSDCRTQITSSLWAPLCSLLNIQHSQTTAYHPQSNGMVQRFHRRLKDSLRDRWVDHLPWVLLGLRAAAREDYSTTPAQAAFGSPLILPGQLLDSPELPSKDFFEQFSKTLSAAEHPSTRHNTAAACAAQGQGPSARRRPLLGFSPARGRGGPQGTFRPAADCRTAQGTILNHAAAGPGRNRRATSRLDLEAWGEPCGGYEMTFDGNGSLKGIPMIWCAPPHFCACAWGPHTREILAISKPT